MAIGKTRNIGTITSEMIQTATIWLDDSTLNSGKSNMEMNTPNPKRVYAMYTFDFLDFAIIISRF
jgi:hypothetical protein